MSKSIEDVVRAKYGAVAASTLSGEHAGVRSVAEAFGYSAEDLSSIPAEANMGLSCGNPTAIANLRPGEVVVDLGSGGGIDVLIAAKKVGPTGKAIGIDMTDEMLDRAKRNAVKAGAENVEFHKGAIDALPLPDSSADCIISNCVINLAPDKRAVFREMARVLKPGGRVAVSDIALKRPLPTEIGQDLLAYVGCIAGAIPFDEYRHGLQDAGFARVEIIDSGADLHAYARLDLQEEYRGGETAEVSEAIASVGCCAPAPVAKSLEACCSPSRPVAEGEPCCTSAEKDEANRAGAACCSPSKSNTPEVLTRLAELARRYDINEYAASVKVFAVKPR